MPTLAELAQVHEKPNTLARIGRGMTDLYEWPLSVWYGMTDPAKAKAYDAQRADDEALYLRGLLGEPDKAEGPLYRAGVLGPGMPEAMRAATPDFWRGVGQAVPFLALGPSGGLRGLGGRALARSAAELAGNAEATQPLTAAPDVWRALTPEAREMVKAALLSAATRDFGPAAASAIKAGSGAHGARAILPVPVDPTQFAAR